MTRFTPLYILLAICLTQSCGTFDRPEPTPSFIKVNKFNLTTDVGNEGENTQNIIDGWVYIDGKLAGDYELPAYVPVLSEGNHDVLIIPGIKSNGISSERKTYPFYTSYETSVTTSISEAAEVSPQTEYQDNVDFNIIEDFESAGIIFSAAASSDTSIVIETGGPTGSYGHIYLASHQNYALVITGSNLILPQSGARVFMELDFRTNNTFRVGVKAEDGASSSYLLMPYVFTPTLVDGTQIWRKIYIELTSIVSSATNTNQFELFIEITKNPSNTEVNMDIDNVKLLHY